MAKHVTTEDRGKRKVYVLSDDATGSTARVLPSYGFNLFDLRLPVAGKVRPVMFAAPDWADNPRSPGGNGTPVLFPFPNRIRDGRFQYEGKTYQIPANNGPNAIHGFAIDANWDVVEQGANENEAFITGQYQISKHSADRTSQWPSDAILRMRYALAGRRLTLGVTVTNPSAQPLPYGFGIHPYFYIPFDASADTKHTSVIVPASEYWVLKDFLPTGEFKPVDARLDFRKGQPIAGLRLDDVLCGLGFEGHWSTCRLVDLAANAEFRLSFDHSFREIVLYTPPRETRVIAVEPYTQTTDAINLQGRGIDAGLRVLRHDEQAQMVIVMETVG